MKPDLCLYHVSLQSYKGKEMYLTYIYTKIRTFSWGRGKIAKNSVKIASYWPVRYTMYLCSMNVLVSSNYHSGGGFHNIHPYMEAHAGGIREHSRNIPPFWVKYWIHAKCPKIDLKTQNWKLREMVGGRSGQVRNVSTDSLRGLRTQIGRCMADIGDAGGGEVALISAISAEMWRCIENDQKSTWKPKA